MQALEEHERALRAERLKELEQERLVEEERALEKAGRRCECVVCLPCPGPLIIVFK